MTTRSAEGPTELPADSPAALAALSIIESLVLTLVEAGGLDPLVARRCLLDAAAGFDDAEDAQGTNRDAAAIIDALLRQIEALAPSASASASASAGNLSRRCGVAMAERSQAAAAPRETPRQPIGDST